MSRIYEITDRVAAYAPNADIDLINRAYVFAAHAHAGQTRNSGEAYIIHPLAVADILASLGMDTSTIITGLLHDTVEDTHVTLADVEQSFGVDVAGLVDGMTKIGQIHFSSKEQKQAENFRKMILATAKDLRVLIVKLADRLHNMRTLGFMPQHKRQAISEETLEIYAPLAHRLGIHWVKQEMEDLSFSYLHTNAYQKLMLEMQGRLDALNRTRERLEGVIQQALLRQGLTVKVQGRMKHLYSIHEKMQRKSVNFEEIFDLLAFRVIVEDMSMCYHALGVVHSLYRPVPGRFKDYIAIPKPNGYQSLHTVVIGPENFRIEIQIRTNAMHFYAEDGVAAHWAYKEGGNTAEQDSFAWLKQLTDLLKETDNPSELLEDVRLDLFVREVYVFSRDGDIYPLPRGARPLDFAYAVHTDVGEHCVGVRINGDVADFSCRLRNGDQIEVMTSPDQTPSRQWLQYVKTPRAKQAIRQWFRKQERDSSMRMGDKILRESVGVEDVSSDVLKACQCTDLDELKMRLGQGDLGVQTLFDAMPQERSLPLKLMGMKRSYMHAAECCHPIPGDKVLGRLKGSEGMALHYYRCKTVLESRQDNWIEVDWQQHAGQLFRTAIEVRSENRRGMLASITACIADADSCIEDLTLHQRGGSMTVLLFLVEVEERLHLARVMRAIKALDGVIKVTRHSGDGLKEQIATRALGEKLRDFFAGRKSSNETKEGKR